MKHLIAAVIATSAVLGAGAAHAGGVQWSIGINVPPVVYAPAPTYYSAPVYAEPVYAEPVYATPAQYAPPIVYRRAPRVVYQAPVPVYNGYGATRIYYEPESVGYGARGGRYDAYRGYPDYRGRTAYPRDGRWDHGRDEDRDDGDHRHRR